MAELKKLDFKDIEALENMLGYPIGPHIPFDYFLKEEKTFGSLVSEILNPVSKALTVDWKWAPENVFGTLEELFPGERFKLLESKNATQEEDRVFSYSIKGQRYDEQVGANDLSAWIGKLSQILSDDIGLCLIEFNTGGDFYAWVVALDDLDRKAFEEIIYTQSEANNQEDD